MAKQSKNKYPQLMSPKMRFAYPRLFTPDTEYDANGIYSVRGLLTQGSPDAIAFCKQLDAEVEKSLALAKEQNPKAASKITSVAPYNTDHDDFPNDVVLNFKMKAKVEPKTGEPFTQKPAVFDAAGIPISPDVRVGGGSTGKVVFEAVPYYVAKDKEAGVSLRMKAVQVIDLKEYDGSRSASSYGFEIESASTNDEDETSAESTEENTDEVDF